MSRLDEEQVRRYSRQILLREVGGRGQERLLASRVRLRGRGLCAEVAAEYLRRAGVGVAEEREDGVPVVDVDGGAAAFAAPADPDDPDLGEVGRGAALALAVLKHLLGLSG